MLTVDGIDCYYGEAQALYGVSLHLAPGRVLCLLGRNGAGKSTTLKAIMGLVQPRAGSVRLDGTELTRVRPYEIPRHGIAYVPQGRGVFPFLTVRENLQLGLLVKGSSSQILEEIFDLFPVLRQRLGQRAGTLSGGEQQMVAMARALCAEPAYLLLDEPTEGLMPLLVGALLETVAHLKERGVGILLVEQKVEAALRLADAVVLMETGHVRFEGTAQDVAAHPEMLLRYVGVRRSGG
jgi:branched-chain amino acid transport system ATP-binding protein